MQPFTYIGNVSIGPGATQRMKMEIPDVLGESNQGRSKAVGDAGHKFARLFARSWEFAKRKASETQGTSGIVSPGDSSLQAVFASLFGWPFTRPQKEGVSNNRCDEENIQTIADCKRLCKLARWSGPAKHSGVRIGFSTVTRYVHALRMKKTSFVRTRLRICFDFSW